MTLISYRECHLFGVKNEDLNRFLEEIKTFFEEEKIPEDYFIIVHKNEFTCCGVRGLMEVAVEIQGPEKQPIEDLDVRIYSKIIEICEREGIEHYECKTLEFVRAQARSETPTTSKLISHARAN